jgi:hypothetical protein
MLRGMSTAVAPLPAAVAAVLAGQSYAGRATRPEAGEATFVVPGSVVRDLVLGRYGALPRPVVRLTGVRIVGDIDLSYCEWRGNLTLLRCRIEGSVDLAHAHVRGRVSLSGSSVRRLDVSNASIEGPLLFLGGKATDGLFGLGLTVSGALNLGRAEIVAPVSKPNRCAVELFRAKLGDLFLARADLQGGLYANGLTVERNVRLQGLTAVSRLALGTGTGTDNAAGQAVSLTGAKIGAALYLHGDEGDDDTPPPALTGGLFLTRVSCASLHAAAEDLAGVDVRLDGCTFERLVVMKPEQWLELIKRAAPDSNQPYIFFATHCQAYGLTSLRRDVLVAMQDQTRAAQGRWSFDRVRWDAWRVFVRYGYQSTRAIGWLAVAAILCAVVLWLGGDFLVRDPDANGVAVRGITGGGDIVAFALDSVLPFAGLGTADGWTARPEGVGQIAVMVLFVTIKFAGWGLAALGLASVTGIAKRE